MAIELSKLSVRPSGKPIYLKGRAMTGAKVNVVVSVVFAVCLVGLGVAHIQLRQETARLRRPDPLDDLAHTYEIEQNVERLDSELRKLKYHSDGVDSKVDHSDFEDLKDDVGRLKSSVLNNSSLISQIPDSSDFVHRFELTQEVLDLEKRIKTIEQALRIYHR